ncbi:MAG: cyclic nucleotide-binding domain-containing protein [Planctomycetes bacterium]|nr:cyclic nucleotide-binding domain-containing protein [Planctomycetota bacterium]
MISPEQLRRFPYFADVSEDALKEVAMISDEISATAGGTLFSEGDPADSLFLITEGEIDLQYTLGNGEQRTVDTLVPGDLAVWSVFVEPYKCTATGKLRTDAKLISINGRKLQELCEANKDLGYRMLISVAQLLATRLEGARVQLATID